MSDARTHSNKQVSTQRLMYYFTNCLRTSNTAGQMANCRRVMHSTIAALNNRVVGASQTNTDTSPQGTDSQPQQHSQYSTKHTDNTYTLVSLCALKKL